MRTVRRPRIKVLYKPPYDTALGKHPHPTLIARGHFKSPEELLAECKARIGVLPPHHRKEGTVLIGHETDTHIVAEAFDQNGYQWKAASGVPFLEFLARHCHQELFISPPTT